MTDINNISCTFTDSPYSASVNYSFNLVDKLVEFLEENKRLYLQLLKEKDEKIVLLERLANSAK